MAKDLTIKQVRLLYRDDPFDRTLEAMKATVSSYLKTLVFEGEC